jgi:hypothetical protein
VDPAAVCRNSLLLSAALSSGRMLRLLLPAAASGTCCV